MDKEMELPEGWKLERLGDICKINMGQSPPSDTYNFNKDGLPFFQGKAEFGERYPKPIKWCSAPNKIAEADDILLSVRAPVGAINMADQRCCIGRGLASIRYPDNKMFIYYFLKLIEKELDKKGTGTTFRAISGDTLRNTLMPFPKLNEQHKIVEKIEELFSELDNGIENLKTAQQQLKVYRQAVLKSAFEGKLTNDNVREGKLPEGWRLAKISDVANVGTGGTPLKSNPLFYSDGNIPWVTSGALNGNYVTEATDYITDAALKRTNCKIYPKNTLLLAMYGEGKTRGKCSELLIEACTNQAIAAIYFEDFDISIKPYLKYFLIKNYIDIRRRSSGGVQPNINLGIVKNLKFPLASPIEQQRIVQEIESRLSVCDKIEETITASLQQAAALRQSILKKAFEGKLVNANDTPVINLYPIADSDKQWQRKVLTGHIVFSFQTGGYIGRTKLQKMLYLCEQHAQLDFDAVYIKEAAGPLDSKFLYAFIKEAKQKNWIEETHEDNWYKYEPGASISQLTKDYSKYFRSHSEKVNFVIRLLKDKSTDESELIATIYGIWNNYLINGCDIHHDQLSKEVYDWSESKSKFSEADISSTWKWMMQVGLKPVGFGKLIEK
jgi:type I restriction enzyme S subunit